MTKKYTTIQGDMWDGVSKKTLGSEHYMDKLMMANPDQLNTVIFPANVTLIIPEIESSSSTQKIPPWKRGGNG